MHSADLQRPSVPPLSRLGKYLYPFPDGVIHELLVDGERLFMIGNQNVVAWPKAMPGDSADALDYPDPLWTREFQPAGTNATGVNLSHPALFNGQLLFARYEFGEFTDIFNLPIPKIQLFSLDAKSGEQNWIVELEGAGAFSQYTGNGLFRVHGSSIYLLYDPPENEWGEVRMEKRSAETGELILTTSLNFGGSWNPVDAIVANNQLIVRSSYKVYAFSSNLSNVWSFPPGEEELESPEGSGSAGQTSDMIAFSNRIFIAQNDYRIFGLDTSGNLLWEKDIPPTTDCSSKLRLACDGKVLVVGGHCGRKVIALDPDTGEEVWRSTTDTFPGMPIHITGGIVLVPNFDLNEDWLYYDVLSLADGARTQQIRMVSAPNARSIAGASGLTYVSLLGNEFRPGDGHTVFVYEAEPAELHLSLVDSDALGCGLVAGEPIILEYRVDNFGPGPARDVAVTVSSPGAAAEFRLDGANLETLEPVTCEGTGSLKCVIGGIPADSSSAFFLAVTPQSEGKMGIDVSIDGGTRNPSSSGEVVRATIDVSAPLPSDLDLSVTGIEVTQVVQDLENSVQMIEGKTTLVRVYVESNHPVDNVVGRLDVDGTLNLPGSSSTIRETLLPIDDCLSISPGTPDRSTLTSTFNFLVPVEYIRDEVRDGLVLTFRLDPYGTLPDVNSANDTITKTVFFEDLPFICMRTYRVRTTDSNDNDLLPPTTLNQRIVDRAVGLMPVHEIRVFPSSHVLEELQIGGWGPYEMDPGGDEDGNKILSTLWWHDQTSNDPKECDDEGARTHYAGMVGEDNKSTLPNGNFNGYARKPGDQLVFRVRDVNNMGITRPAGGTTLAHEFGHNYGRAHVDCNNPDGIDNNYPYDSCQLGPVQHEAFYGADLAWLPTVSVVAPQPAQSPESGSTGDLMSYANTTWTSDYTYNAFIDKLRGQLKEARESGKDLLAEERAVTKAEEVVLLSASVAGDGVVTIETVHSLPQSNLPKRKVIRMAKAQSKALLLVESLTAELLDGGGNVLASAALPVEELSDSPEAGAFAGGLLPFDNNAASVRLTDGTQTLAERLRSSNSPTVAVTAPVAGETISDSLTINWQGTDADGDELNYAIQYSADNGLSWQTLRQGAGGDSLTLDASLLSGTNGNTALVRVIANDGFNSAAATSNAFTVMRRTPLVTISQPLDGAIFNPGDAILLRGSGFDPEDGGLEGGGLVWTSDGDVELATGGAATLRGLAPGMHALTLTATDSDGTTASSTVLIEVSMPLAHLGSILAVIAGEEDPQPDRLYDINGDGVIDSADYVALIDR